MAYERLHWVESETPLSADNMNNIEDGIEELQSQKVDKVSGKALSDNNYTSDEKTKLAGIEAGAQVNPGAATTSANGLMSAADKTKLNGIEAGAQVNPGNATTSAAGLMSASDKSKLNGIEAGANNYALTTETLTANITAPATVSPLSGRTLTFSATGLTSAYNLIEIVLDCDASGICISGWQYVNGSMSVKVFNTTHTGGITIRSSSYIRLRKYK